LIKRPQNPERDGYIFDAWYIDDETFLQEWDFDIIPETAMTLYAGWHAANRDTDEDSETILEPGINPSIDVSELIEKTPGFDSGIILSQTGTGANRTMDVPITGTFQSIYWEIQGVGKYAGTSVSGTSSPITLNAAEPIYNSLGFVIVEVRVTVNGLQYQTSFKFKIIE